MISAKKSAGFYPGPTGKRYELPREIQAWEADWAAQAGREYEDLGPAEHARRAVAGEADPNPEAKRLFNEAVAYIRDYRGSWGFILDLRASATWGTKYFRLSERQVAVVLASKAREAKWALERELDAELAAAAAYENRDRLPAPPPAKVTEDGIYRTPDGTVVKVQIAVHGSGNLYGKRLDLDTGEFVYEAGLLKLLRPEYRLSREEAGALGKLYGRCMVCGRTLTDEYSIANGIGPVCAGRGWKED